MRDKIVLEKARNEGLALTFDDVRLRSNYAEDMPDEVDVGSKFSRNVRLKIPIVSAAMDNVTEYGLAIELAKLGGIGVIHRKNISIKDQVSHVEKVKYHLNGLIEKPIWVYEDESVFSILSRREEKGYTFHSFPVLNREGKLVGIITGKDFEFCRNSSLKAKDIMTTELLLAPMGTTIDEAYERVARLSEKNVDVIVIDTAHGDSKYVIDTLKEIKRNYSLDVVVGNVSIGESAKRLVNAGADGIKVGQGPGSICTTRVIAGIGRPQVSAVYDCAKAIEESDIPICADGGLRNSGDITIAIAAGAHSVMMGSMLAGTEEAPGNIIFVEGRQWKSYRGMGSLGAMEISGSSRERYLQQQTEKNQLIPEGVEGLAPYKGRLADVIFQYIC